MTVAAHPPFKTDHLILRDFAPGDFEAFYATSLHPLYQQFYSEEETTRTFWQVIFERILASTCAAERRKYQLAVCLPSGELIGTCGVRMEDAQNQQASFGCAIDHAYWGMGYAYEASRCLLGFGFSTLPIHRIYAETIGENHRARALAETLGMRLEGVLKQARYFRNRWWDTALYAMLKDEWETLKTR